MSLILLSNASPGVKRLSVLKKDSKNKERSGGERGRWEVRREGGGHHSTQHFRGDEPTRINEEFSRVNERRKEKGTTPERDGEKH